MSSIPFDTRKMAERLVGAGVPADQAKMQATLLAEVISAEEARFTERFSGKQDLAQELSAIRMPVEKLDSKIDTRCRQVLCHRADFSLCWRLDQPCLIRSSCSCRRICRCRSQRI